MRRSNAASASGVSWIENGGFVRSASVTRHAPALAPRDASAASALLVSASSRSATALVSRSPM